MRNDLIRARPGGFVAALALCVGVWGCEPAGLDRSPGGGVNSPTQKRSVRARITSSGIGSLLDISHPSGLELQADARETRASNRAISLGPVEQAVALESLRTESRPNDRLAISATTGPTSVVIPVRVQRDPAPRICRFRLDASRWTLKGEAKGNGAEPWRLELDGQPTATFERPRIQPLGACPELLDDGEVPADLESALGRYLRRAIRTGLSDLVDIAIYERLGLLEGRLSLERRSSFSNRRGRLELEAAPPDDNPVELDGNGLRAALDVSVASRRADCMAADSDSPPPSTSAAPIATETLVAEGGEYGLALARPLVARLVRAAVLGGFLCRGLDPPFETSGRRETIRSDEADLSTVNLDGAPIRGPFTVTLNPGTAPDFSVDTSGNAVQLAWSTLEISLYGRRNGTRLRLLTASATATFDLRPTGGSGTSIPFDVRSVSVENADFESPWTSGPEAQTTVTRWTRGLLLTATRDLFRIPVPLLPRAPVEATGARVRADDLLVVLRFEPN